MSNPLFFYSDTMLRYDMGPQHPMRPERLRMTYDLLDSYGLFGRALEVATPTLASTEVVEQTHSRDFLEMLFALNAGEPVRNMQRYGFGTGDNPVFAGIYEASLRYTGATLDAAQAILEGEGGGQVAFNIAGGLHHAHYARAAGFCVLNDCAVGIRRLREKFGRVAYVDIDVHHGDGVQELFYEDPTVLTLSLHESGRFLFPGTGYTEEIGAGAGEGYSVNLPYAPYTTDEIWLSAWREVGLPLLKAFDPEAILLQMGTDSHLLDPLALLCTTAQGWLEAVKDVQALGKPIVAVGGGGYNLTTVPRMWTLAVATLAGQELPDAVPTSYPDQAKIPTLTDHVRPADHLDPRDIKKAETFAAQTVREVKERLFPYHGLS